MFGFQNCGKSSFKLRDGITGLSGLNADDDADGLTNGAEQAGTTDPNNPDSDNDGLLDGEEVNTYNTDPMNPDSDAGGLNDGDEVNNGSDPNKGNDDAVTNPPADQDTDKDGLTDVFETSTSNTDPLNPDSDNDGLNDGEEVNTYKTNPLNPDTDGGSVLDGQEVTNGTNPKDNPSDDAGLDSDNDGLTDNYEQTVSKTDPQNPDSDDDGLLDGEEVSGPKGNAPTDPNNKDTDDDGLDDGKEVNTYGSDPNNKDTDGGGVEDGPEVSAGTSPTNKQDDNGSPFADDDNDGLTNIVEENLGTDPQNPDTDGDGLLDGPEVIAHATDPKNPDTDGGGVNDGEEVDTNKTNPNDKQDDLSDPNKDSDKDGLTDILETNTGTDPNNPDSDNDGLSDGAEVLTHGTNPLDPDTDKGGVNDGTEVQRGSDPKADPSDDKIDPKGDDDKDGLTNEEEIQAGTNPHDPDTDDDGLKDGAEIKTHKTDPNNSDTDGGGVNDGVEVARGSDPNSKQDDLIQSSNCTVSKGLAVWSDPINSKQTANSNYLGPLTSYKGALSGATNYAYKSASAHPVVGPQPEEGKLKVFLYEGKDGLMASFFINKDNAPNLFMSLSMNVTTYGNTSSDKVILSDDRGEMKLVSSAGGENKYSVNMRLNKNSDGAVFGPFNSKNSMIHFEILSSKNLGAIEVHSLNGQVYNMQNTHFMVGYRDFMTCACSGGDQKINFTNLPQPVGTETSGEITFETTFNSDALATCTINDVAVPNGCFSKTPVNFNEFFIGEHEFKVVVEDNEGASCEAKFKWEIKGSGCVDCEVPVTNDSDNDGLSDDDEKKLGTDPSKADTDGDSLADGAEVNKYKSDPLKKDTDGGGVEDGAEVQRGSDPIDAADDKGNLNKDDDNDGLSNEVEAQLGTDLKNPDTDGDGLKDGPEVNSFKTDPLKKDTDGGGAEDGMEVSMGGDPLNSDDDDLLNRDPAALIDTDNDGLLDSVEKTLGTDPNNPDSDGDSLIDGAEVNDYKSNPLDKDTDKGGVEDGVEVQNGTDPTKSTDDSEDVRDDDGDGLTNTEEARLKTDPNNPDTDGDGLRDGFEVNKFKTDPTKKDTDGGGMNDGDEVNSGFDPLDAKDDNYTPPIALLDVDGDGLLDSEELKLGTDPLNPDSDDDGLNDGSEVKVHKTNPKDPDSDNDGLTDGKEVTLHKTNPLDMDTDGDALKDGEEVTQHKTDPQNVDTDGDGLKDGGEVITYKTNPLKKDTDDDSLNDGDEVKSHKTDPSKKDTDGDTLMDGIEVNKTQTDPTKQDTDADGLTDGDEVKKIKTNPILPDSDEDSLIDGEEVKKYKTDPIKKDSDGDSLSDGEEVLSHKTSPTSKDSDGDGLDDSSELSKYKTNPNVKDTDGDGLNDGNEVKTYKTDPTEKDTDKDKLSDSDEVLKHKTNPLKTDSDGDTLSDGAEVLTHKTNPLSKDTDKGGVNDDIEVKKGTNPVNDPQDDRKILGIVDGQWTPWTEWKKTGACIKGSQKLIRSRSCANPAPAKGGKKCIDKNGKESLQEQEVKNETCVPEPGQWGPWAAWEVVSECVDSKHKLKTYRTCSPHPVSLQQCLKEDGTFGLKDEKTTYRKCTPPPVDGGWSPWEKWQALGVCDINTMKQKYISVRRCTNPAPLHGGEKCKTLKGSRADTEDRSELRSCKPDPINGAWGLWSKWKNVSECDVKTFKQKFQRTRLCDSPSAQFGGKLCSTSKGQIAKVETATVFKSCRPDSIDGGWGPWSKWVDAGDCNYKTLKKRQVKTRKCDSPRPQFSGKICTKTDESIGMIEEITRSIACKPPAIDGGWSAWSAWKEKTKCDPKTRKQEFTRTRNCNQPKPMYGGKKCRDKKNAVSSAETETVKRSCQPAPIDGGWGAWGSWKALDKCSNEGKIRYIRYRTCNKPLKQFGGKECPNPVRLLKGKTPAMDSQITTKSCTPPVGVWSGWSAKEKAGVCKNGVQKYKQVRTCRGPGICKNKKGESATTEVMYSEVSCAGTWGAWSSTKVGACANGKARHSKWRICQPSGKLCKHSKTGKWVNKEDSQIDKPCTVAAVCTVDKSIGTALPPANVVQTHFKKLSGGYFHKMYLPQSGTQMTTSAYSQWKQFIQFEKCVKGGKVEWKVKDYTSPVRKGEVYGAHGFTGKNSYTIPCLMDKNGRCIKKWLDGKNHGYSSCMYRVHNGGGRPATAGEKVVNGRRLSFCDLTGDVEPPPTSQNCQPKIHSSSGSTLSIEAECFSKNTGRRGQNWRIVSKGGASNNKVMEVPNANQHRSNKSNSPQLDYKIKFSSAGWYTVWVRGYAQVIGPNSYHSDSLHVGINGNLSSGLAVSGFSGNRYMWSNQRMNTRTRARIYVPSKGTHTISVWMREDGMMIDKLLFTKDSKYTPSGYGPR